MSLRIAALRLISDHSGRTMFPRYSRKLSTKIVHSFCTPHRICHSFCSSSKPSAPLTNFTLIQRLHLGFIHLCSKDDIPLYLRDIANEVPHIEEDLFDMLEDELDDHENDMENEIIDFFLARALSYEEMDGSFSSACPLCSHKDKSHDLFIDKNSGYAVCPWCSWDGTWGDLVNLFDSREDCLNQEQLDLYLSSLQPLDKSHSKLLNASSFKTVSLKFLRSVGAGISEDQSQIGIPLFGAEEKPSGFVSISLLHPKPKVVQRFIEGESGIFSNFPIQKMKNSFPNLMIVSNVFDAFHLSTFGINSIVVNSDLRPSTISWIFQDIKKVTFCMENCLVPPSLLSYFQAHQVKCSAIRLAASNSLISLSKEEIRVAMKDAIPINVSNKDLVEPRDLQSEVYNRIINKEKIYGVKWTRFTELNNLLLGHRAGELTVFTGTTGSGKTTFMAEYSLDLVTQGVCTLWGSFEISLPRLYEVMLQQHHGKPLPTSLFEFRSLTSKFDVMPLHFLNFHGQKPLEDVLKVMTVAVLTKGVKHVIIDNLQFMMGDHASSNDQWFEQDKAVAKFRQFATALNCHVTLIVHSRKLQLGERINLQTISGGARVTQEADNVLILQVSTNKDGTLNTLGPKTLQVVKNRYGGTLGEMKLRFHKDSLTLSSIFRFKDSRQELPDNKLVYDFKGLPELDSIS